MGYLPKHYTSADGVSKESYYLAISGGLPLKHCIFIENDYQN